MTGLEEATTVRKGRRGAGCATRVVEEGEAPPVEEAILVEEGRRWGEGRRGG
jgi:hypothetical protein